MRSRLQFQHLVRGAAAALLACACVARGGDAPASERFRRDVEALCRGPHRLAGTAELKNAAEYVAAELRAAGVATVILQPVRVPHCETECSLKVEGRSVPVYPLRANLWQASISGPEPIRGRTLFAEDGELESYGENEAEGRIVVLSYETAWRWEDAFAMGARAVIFVERGGEPLSFARHESIPADLPRFYVRAEDAAACGLLDGEKDIELASRAQWSSAVSYNVLGYFPGTNAVFALESEELLVLSAQLDSFGEVPTLTPDALGAANCATLLETARQFSAHPPDRSVLVAFLGAEARCLSGSAALYTAIYRHKPFLTDKRTHADFANEYRSEKAFIGAMIEAMRSDAIWSPQTEPARRALDLLRRRAEMDASAVRSRLGILRLEKARRGDGAAGEADAVIAALIQEEETINALRRALARLVIQPNVAERLALTRDSALKVLEARDRELDDLLRSREISQQIGELAADKAIVLHLGLDFGDRGTRWGIVHYDNSEVLPLAEFNNVGFYPGVFAAMASTLADLQRGEKALLAEPRTMTVQVGPPLYFPAAALSASQMASRFGIFGLRLATCHDVFPLRGHPHGRVEAINLDRMAALGQDALPFILELARTPALSLRQRIRPSAKFEEPEWNGSRVFGRNVMVKTVGSAIAVEPGRGALLALNNYRNIPGFDLAVRYIAGQDGYVAFGPIDTAPKLNGYPVRLWSAFMTDRNGVIEFACQTISDLRRIELFPCRPFTIVSRIPPDLPIAETTALNAMNDGPFQGRESFRMERNECSTFFAPLNVEAVKTINNFGLILLNASEKEPSGEGFPMTPSWRLPDTERHGAIDLMSLNEYRLNILRERRLTNDSLEWLHGLSKAALRRASEATTQTRRYAELAIARLLQRRVYEPLRSSMDDLVRAVVILLLLTIPFAHALERLIIGTPHIYRQIAWYCAFFLATFGLLYVVHPAFAIATEPIVIFLAFVIILLSAIVIGILLNRFQTEIKALQGLPVTVHSADVSRFGTVMAAISMGISTMRRRTLRTALTTATVILLTFSILSFASFDAQQGVLRRYIGSTEGVRAIFMHNAFWQNIPPQTVEVVRHAAGEDAQVTVRRWVAASRAGEASQYAILAAQEDRTNDVRLIGIVGLDPDDLRAQPNLQACFPGGNADALVPGSFFLPPALAEGLDARIGDRILVRGHALTFAGVLDDAALTRFQQIDKTPLFPVDYNDPSLQQQNEAIEGTGAQSAQSANMESDAAFLPYYSANQVAFVHTETARQLNGRTVALSVYPRSAASDMRQLSERFARLVSMPVYVTLADGVYRLFFTTVLAVAGAGTLLIPIILGGLIVFGTMLGSVTDREKEIYSFSALGLAPTHIGMLFFAEAAVYAVVGGMGGYLLAQIVAFVTGWLSQFTSLSVPEMNYSSTNAIVAILVVMATVLLSTIYPAYRGSKSANPGVIRSWRLPRAQGDVWEFMFPFTVSEYDITGVMSFLREHFDNYSDCSLGVFLAEGTRIEARSRSLTLSSRVATAPFDLGVTQTFELTSIPSEIEGIDEIKVVIRRESGTQGDWRRTNRPFISDLRKQFLIWRSLPPETTEIYRRRTLEYLGREATAAAGERI